MTDPITYNIALIGNSGVGKTMLIKQLTTNILTGRHMPTLGMGRYNITHMINGVHKCYDVFDIAGNENYRSSIDKYLDATDGAIVMFRSDDYSKKSIEQWIDLLPDDIPTVVVENKISGYPLHKEDMHDLDLKMDVYYSSIDIYDGETMEKSLLLLGTVIDDLYE